MTSSVVTIGSFDGVHRGHQMLIRNIVERARELGARSIVVTFEPVPLAVLRPDRYRGRICTAEEKLELLRETGIDDIDVLPFSLEMAGQTPEDFLADLTRRLNMVEIWVGDDFALGRNRSGDVSVISELGKRLGYSTNVIDRVAEVEETISSTAIRRAIERGDVETASTLLGRCFHLSGEVVHGAHLGRKIGYPTANIVPPPGIVQLADGIYASYARLPGALHPLPAMTYAGTRPTVDDGDRHIETNIFDFDGDLYGQVLTIDLVARVRADETFDGLAALVEQLEKDERAVRALLSVEPDTELVTVDRES